MLYEGPGYPYAVEAPEGEVRGELVTARPEAYEELLGLLDRLEEYVPGDPRNLYDRVERPVVREADGTTVRAWVYVAAPAVAVRLRARGTRVEGGDWRGRPETPRMSASGRALARSALRRPARPNPPARRPAAQRHGVDLLKHTADRGRPGPLTPVQPPP